MATTTRLEMIEDNEAKVVDGGPCPHCGHIPLREEKGWTICDGCLARWRTNPESQHEGEET